MLCESKIIGKSKIDSVYMGTYRCRDSDNDYMVPFMLVVVFSICISSCYDSASLGVPRVKEV